MFLYYITDRRQLSTSKDNAIRLLLQRIEAACKARVELIQLREKDLSARELVELGTRAVEILKRVTSASAASVRTRLLINSRIDVAIACGADGVHLRSDDVSAADARVIFAHAERCDVLVGVSCHSVGEVSWAEGHGANFAVYGPIFGKACSSAGTAGVNGLIAVCKKRRSAQPSMPVLALGGVTIANAADCLKAGARGIAGIRLFQDGNMSETVSKLRKLQEQLHC